MRCPCCGSVISSPPDVSAIREVRAGTQTHALLNHLVDIYPKGATLDQLVGQMWDHARVPDTPHWNVRSIIKDARRKIARYGWTISRAKGREISKYRLARIDLEDM